MGTIKGNSRSRYLTLISFDQAQMVAFLLVIVISTAIGELVRL